ncbi:two-component system chemotaxis response regulator CheB [Aquabacterium commune]|uniref:Protein-glutamate methylesterase/protein-glutamine glutaminase n=1 Tax=Aquabacterium commune TaxID=70586 RepID=A0A4R6R666_9BURK|nr:chemotaxis-specific protein-glutamate methyltransferase CheB [Aquabacterium commune]TDP81274.1 two-component system chemotaxis response regulator CheB [Aquabacterium commune]
MPHKVLVVDDSALMRRLITGVLGGAGYEVQIAHNGTEGVEKLVQWQPDVVTLDINMPQMDGLTALSLMMAARPTPVVMVSSLTEEGALATFEALALGAVDFITKPGGTISLSIDEIEQQLLAKVKSALRARPRGARAALPRAQPTTARTPASPQVGSRFASASASTSASTFGRPVPSAPAAAPAPTRSLGQAHKLHLVIVGVSTGGPRTLEDILPKLAADFPCPVLVAQHMPPNFTDAFARRMDRLCALRVREVNAPMPLEPGHIYIGQGGTDMVVMERMGRLLVAPKPETPGHPWHPSVDVLVDTAMSHLPPDRITGVLLTGMGNDGAEAMTRLKREGGRTIAEAESTAVVFGMPQELIQKGGATTVLPCQDIARQLSGWLHRPERTSHGIAKSH